MLGVDLQPHKEGKGGVHRGSRSVQVPQAAAGLVGRQLNRGPTEHQEGAADVGPYKEYATEGGGGTVRLVEVLSRGDTYVVVVWG